MIAAFALLRRIPIWAWAILALLAAIGVQRVELGHYRTRAAADTVALAKYRGAQTANLETIATLQLANRQWAEKYDKQMQDAKFYVDAIRDYSAQLQVKKAAAEHTIQVIYEHDPSARQWAVTRVPSVAADQLRANARRPNADR